MMEPRTRRSGYWGVLWAILGLIAAVAGARPQPVQADTGTTPWAYPTAIATGLPEAARPALVYTTDGVGHAMWESEGKIYYATQQPGRPWNTARRIAYGMSPTLATDQAGQLRALFANQFMGNYEIYQIMLVDGAWTLPTNISHTSGLSAYPVLVAGKSQTMYAAWMDNSPGYWTIYVGKWNGAYWSSQPVANARGQAPALAATPDGGVYLAWQDRVPTVENPNGVYDIFLSEQGEAGWSLPVNISDEANTDSIGPSLTAMYNGLAHLTWINGNQEVQYCFGRGWYWPVPQTVVRAVMVARGPRIALAREGMLSIAWDEGDMVRATTAAPAPPIWPKPAIVATISGDLRDVSLAALPAGGVAVGWVQALRPGDAGVYESRQTTEYRSRAWLPIMVRE